MVKTLACVAGVAALVAVASPVGRSAARPLSNVQTTLQRIDELRRLELAPGDDQPFTFDRPGLTLTFGIELPDDRELVQLGEPAAFIATDSTGRDLTTLPASPYGEPKHVELVEHFGQTPSGFKLMLGTPARSATTVDVDATMEVVSYAGTREVSLALGSVWRALDPEVFGPKAEGRLEVKPNGIQLQLRPGSLRTSIDEVVLTDAGTALESSFTMWNDGQVSYAFAPASSARLDATVRVRTDLRTDVLRVRLAEQRLP